MPQKYKIKDVLFLIKNKSNEISLEEIIIEVDSIYHIILKDVLELGLHLRGYKKIIWKDIHGEISAENIFMNMINLCFSFIIFPYHFIYNLFNYLKVSFGALSKIKNKTTVDSFLFLRTDHWFNLRSGGSVGHISGVANALNKKKKLKYIISSDKLHQVNEIEYFQVVSPNYKLIQNIIDFPNIAYNTELINSLKKQSFVFDVLYQRYSLGNFVGVFLKKIYQVPFILEFNGSEVWVSKNWAKRKLFFLSWYEKIERLNLVSADVIVVVSQPLKNQLISWGIEPNKILVNPNGVDIEKYNPSISGEEIREKYSLESKTVFGFIGTFGEWHGVVELANAINLFYTKNPSAISNTKFLLIGDGNLMPQVKEIIQNGAFSEQVIFTGKIPQQEGAKYLAACDVFLSPHIPNPDGSDFFGSPTKLFEYMAMGNPIIASNLNQIGEILEDKKTALLVKPADISELADKMKEILEDKKLQTILGENAYKQVIERHTWDKHVDRIIEKLKSVLDSN